MNKEELFDKIEQYLANGLDDQEKQLFEAQLKVDESLQKEVALHRELRDTISQQPDKERFLENLSTVHDEFTGSSDARDADTSLWKKYYRAAIFVLVVGCGFIFYKMAVDTSSPDELFTEYFVPYENFITSRGNDDTLLSQAMLFYDQNDHKKAVDYFDQMADIGDPTVSLYYGISLLHEDQTSLAKEKLQLALKNGSSLVMPVAQWYLALLHLKENNERKARSYLTQILEDPKSAFYDKAKALLDDLE